MAAYFVAMSDLHLGYDRSVWVDPQSYDRVAGAVADLCGGSTRYLVLDGDAFEACVPARVGEYDAAGFPVATAEETRSYARGSAHTDLSYPRCRSDIATKCAATAVAS